ncbi:hypothetical protein HPB52_017942 [Rhipicephalus sanguineus]|uniref:Ig-like domain-containing protein n=1 Tax=Rhipicephalus sanguineus TaxID=34632 RepID=A0A9D4Q1R1_RHISA|nr:hypothetical protein HPB52_017942 [Rhipicephalus sanguineus]
MNCTQELLRGEHQQRVDFRLQSLSDVSSEQLFFVYYALDNCESTYEAYQATQFRTHGRLPAAHRVNFPLRHLPQFARAFRCNDSDATATTERPRRVMMVAPKRGHSCDVMRCNSTDVSGSVRWYRRLAQVRSKSFASRRNSSVTTHVTGGNVLSFPGRDWMIAGREACV